MQKVLDFARIAQVDETWSNADECNKLTSALEGWSKVSVHLDSCEAFLTLNPIFSTRVRHSGAC